MNTQIPLSISKILSSLGIVESIQSPKIRAGGPSSSRLLNDLALRAKKDITRLASDVVDVSDYTRVLSEILSAQNAGLVKVTSSLNTQLTNLITQLAKNKAFADFYANTLTVADSSQTTADINPLFGQAILPSVSRQNVLVIELPDGRLPEIPSETQILFAIQPAVTSTSGAQPPSDISFGEDLYSVFALDAQDNTAWIVEDPTSTGHVVWVEIRLPGSVSGSYRCNELELVPCPAYGFSVFNIRAESVGSAGWQDLDISYLNGYDTATKSVINFGPSRLCFPEASITRFRVGMWVSNIWGFSSIRVLNASYKSSAVVTVDYSSYNPGSLINPTLYGSNSNGSLQYLPVSITGSQVSATLQQSSGGSTPCVTGLSVNW